MFKICQKIFQEGKKEEVRNNVIVASHFYIYVERITFTFTSFISQTICVNKSRVVSYIPKFHLDEMERQSDKLTVLYKHVCRLLNSFADPCMGNSFKCRSIKSFLRLINLFLYTEMIRRLNFSSQK